MVLSVLSLFFLDCVLEQDVKYERGENLFSPDGLTLNKVTRNKEQCANLCADTIGCAFWSWDGQGGKMCFLKKSSARRVAGFEGFVSGTPQCGEGKHGIIRNTILKEKQDNVGIFSYL